MEMSVRSRARLLNGSRRLAEVSVFPSVPCLRRSVSAPEIPCLSGGPCHILRLHQREDNTQGTGVGHSWLPPAM